MRKKKDPCLIKGLLLHCLYLSFYKMIYGLFSWRVNISKPLNPGGCLDFKVKGRELQKKHTTLHTYLHTDLHLCNLLRFHLHSLVHWEGALRPLTPDKQLGLIWHSVCCSLDPAAVSPSMHQQDVPDHQVCRGCLLKQAWKTHLKFSKSVFSR